MSRAGAAVPGLHVQRPGPVARRRASRSGSRTTTGTTPTRRSCSSASTAGPASERYIYHGNDGTELPVERHGPARLPQAGRPRGGHPDDPRRRAPVPDHPLRRRDGPAPRSTSSGCGTRSPATAAAIPSAPSTRCRRPSSTGAMPVEFWREVVDRVAAEAPDTLLLAEAFWLLEGYFVRTLGHAPRLQQRVHAHAPRRGQRRLPAGDREHARVRPGDPQALRELHEQPRREDGGRAVRQGRQVLRRGHAAGDAARAADVRARPDRGLRREVRHGVPPRRLRRAARRCAARRRHEREIVPLLHRRGGFAEVGRLPAVRRRRRRRRPSTRTSSPTRTSGRPASARSSSTTTATPRPAGRSASRSASTVGTRTASGGSVESRWPPASGSADARTAGSGCGTR